MKVPLPLLVAALLGAGTWPAFGAVGGNPSTALSDFDTQLGGYNLLTTGNATLNNYSDTQGALAIGGALTLNSTGAIATQAQANSGFPTLFVAGGLTLTGTTMLNSGYASLPGLSPSGWTWNSTQHDLSARNGSGDLNTTNAGAGAYSNSSPLTNPGPSGWSFASRSSSLLSDSNALASATTNGTISVSSQTLTFTPNGTPAAGSVVVFSLDASNLTANTYNGQTISNLSINVPADVNYVINVTNAAGRTIFGSGVNFNAGANDGQLLWNLEGSGSVTLGGGQFFGAVLAPQMNVANTNNTILTGQVAAASFADNNAELHFEDFAVAAAVVPEPATFALWGAGLCGAAILGRRRLLG